jgi:Ring finger domain
MSQQQQQQQDDNNDSDVSSFLRLTQEQQQRRGASDEILVLTEPTTTSSDLLNLTAPSSSASSSSSPPEKVSPPRVTKTPAALPAVSLQTLQPVVVSPPLQTQSPQQPQQQQQQPSQPVVLEEGFSILGVWILACLLFILSAILVVLVVHVIRQRHRILSIMFPNSYQYDPSSRQSSSSSQRRRRNPSRTDKATLARIERRYETIEGWIVSKRVVDHDEFCESCVDVFAMAAAASAAANASKTLDAAGATDAGAISATDTGPVDKDADAVEFGMHTKEKQRQRLKLLEQQQQQQQQLNGAIEQGGGCSVIKHLETCDTEDEDDDDDSIQQAMERECPICFEEFRVGQVISFSANPECRHVFHHECIKEWLLRHINCPFCRKVCLHVDEYRTNGGAASMKTKPHVIQELLDKHSKRSATTYYCVRDGLVVIPPKVRCTKRELKQLKHRICDCIVDRQELAKMRGNRPEASCSVTTNTQAMLREINLTETTTTATTATDWTEAAATATATVGGGVGVGATTILGIAHRADDGNQQTTVFPSVDEEALTGVQQLNLHLQAPSSTEEPSARPIALQLEMASVEDENDYDPTEREDQDDLSVFPQGHLDDASVSEHVTLECDDDDDSSSTDSSATAAAEKEAVYNSNYDNGSGPPRRGVGAVGSSSSLSMMMLGRHQTQQYDNNSSRTTGTSTDDDEEMLLQEVEDVDVENSNNNDDQDDDGEYNVIVQGNGEDENGESHQSNMEGKTVTTTPKRRASLADDAVEVSI